ncbi:hypothetical protein ACWDUM_07725 [Rhodococcus sp. NPDC003322]
MGEGRDGPPPTSVNETARTAESLALEVAEAEAEAEAAEARTAAAQARARSARLRRQALAAEAGPATGARESSLDSTDGPAPRDLPTAAAGKAENEDVPDCEGVGPSPSDGPRPRHGGRRLPRPATVPAALCALVSGAALAASGYLLWHHHDVTDQQQRAAEFAAAARQGVVTLTTLDSDNAEADVQRVLDNSTGAFRDDFQARAGDFTDMIQKANVATEGRVNAAAVESMTEDSAVVLVAASSKVTNSAGAEQEPRAWRLSVTVTRDEGQLKMSKVEFVP